MASHSAPRRKNLAKVLNKFCTLSLALLEDRSVPSITGTVFQDFNANGVMDLTGSIANSGQGSTPTAVDRGMSGVTVTAYDVNNAIAAAATTGSSGNYTLDPVGAGPFRVEFTNLPAGVYFGPQGTTSGSAVQFVSSASVINVNLGVVRPEDFSPNNPTLVTASYVVGGSTNSDLNPGTPVIISFPYAAGSADSDSVRGNHQQPMTHDLNVAMRDVGTTWGLAYDANTNKIYASAYMKRTTGFGPSGPGAIYQMGTFGSTSSLYANLNAIYGDFPAGNLNALYTDNNGNAVPYRTNITDASYWFRDGLVQFTDENGVIRDLGWDAVGKIALGGLDLSVDGSKLFTIALGDRRLYQLPTSGALNTSTVQRFDLPIPTTVTGITAANPLGDLRPFAVTSYRGLVYVGAVNSAESTQNAADLRAYVFVFDPATGQFINGSRQATTTQAVFEFALNYPRGNIHIGNDPNPNFPGGHAPADPAEWNPWSPVHRSVEQQPFALGRSGYPQPMLTGISFDNAGNMTLGLRDRSGDQFGRNVPIDPANLNDFSPFSMTAGDILRVGINTPYNLDMIQAGLVANFAGWSLESNGRVNGAGGNSTGSGQGPGGGEFFFDDNFPRDPNTPPVGNVAENDEVSMGAVLQMPGFNQSLATSFDPVRILGAVNSGGIRWYDNGTGGIIKSYEIYATPNNSSTSTFAKGNGLGDLIAVTGTPPIEIGNFVWLDTNRNGIQDAGETGLAGVSVDLYTAGANNTFGDGDDVKLATAVTDANGNYIFSSGNGVGGTSRIYGLNLKANSDYQIRVGTGQAAMAGRDFTLTTADVTANGTARDSNASTLGVANVHTTVAGAANHSIDIGVVPIPTLALGDIVWNDLNNDGRKQANEPGVDGVTVNLYLVGGTTPFATQTTTGGGNYLFTDLSKGSYFVEILPPNGFRSSTGQIGKLTGPFEPGATGNENDADHGSNTAIGVIRSGTVVLGAPGDPINPNSNGPVANAANLNIDFGIIRPLSIGNLVWNDVNNDGQRQLGEPGIAGVEVDLRNLAGDLVATTMTNSFGGYLFFNVPVGIYRVEIVRSTLPSLAYISSTGANSLIGGPSEPASGTSADSTDYGSLFGNVVRGPLVNLNYGTQPTGEDPAVGPLVDTDADGDSDLRQDFGFFRTLTLGNQVWFDTNNDGLFNNGERGAGGVAVQLLNAGGTAIATTTTGADGTYLFRDLFPGTYRVQITSPTNFTSSTGKAGSLSGPYEPANPANGNDNEDKGTANGGLIVSTAVTLDFAGSGKNPSLGGLGNLTVDFGLVQRNIVVPPPPPPPANLPASVSGYVYRDIFNTNGQRETSQGETGIGGVAITLNGTLTAGGTVTLTTTTNGLGYYSFTNLEPGSYVISERQPLGFYDGIDTFGSLGGTVPSNDVLTVNLASGDNGVEYNFGEVLGASVFGFVYEDLNQNHRMDVGEPGISGVTVTLSGIAFAGTPMAHPIVPGDSITGLVVRTDASGRWEFPLIPAGSYTLVETQPAGYADFFESDQGPVVRPVNIGNDIFATAALSYNETRGPLNYGEIRSDFDNTKRNFLGSTGGGAVGPSTTPPVAVTPQNVSLNPAFTVNTGRPNQPAFVVVGASSGRTPLIRVFDYSTGVERFRLYAYEDSFNGGVRVATGDTDGDGVPDIVTCTGVGGGPRVRVFSGADGHVLRDYFAYEDSFRGGVFVACADVTGDGIADIITGTELGGGPRVTVFDAVTGNRVQDFFAFDGNQRGGVRVAAVDFNNDGRADIVTTTGAGVQTRVRVYDAATHAILADFTPYTAGYTGGVFIAAGDVTGDGRPDIVTGADVGGGPHVQVFDSLSGRSISSFFAGDASERGGIRVALQDVDGDGVKEIVTGAGPGAAARVRLWKFGAATPLEEFYAFDTTYTGGVYVG